MSRVKPCLMFEGEAEAAARFYVSLLPESRIDHVQTSPVDTPSGPAGSVLLVAFTLAGQPYQALNMGQPVQHTQAVSFSVSCADQAEVDRLWAALTEGGRPIRCGWLHDRYGVTWQVVPEKLPRLLRGPDQAGSQRAMRAMMGMVKLDVAALQAAYDAV